MAWDDADRAKYKVIRDRYGSDLSDEEFGLIEPLLPAPKPRGRKPTDARTILNALFYMIRCGCPWRYLPRCFPPFTTVQNRFYSWRDSGLWDQIVAVLVMAAREDEGKEAAPSVVIVDSQSVKTTEVRGPRGYDAAKKVKGRKRHIAVDTLGLPIECQITPADVQDRDALPPVLKAVHQKSPWVEVAFVDGGYSGDETERAAFEASRIKVTVVKRSDRSVKGFVVLPKRWIVERTLGWLNRSRRLAKDFEATLESSYAWVMLAISSLLLRRLALHETARLTRDFESGSQFAIDAGDAIFAPRMKMLLLRAYALSRRKHLAASTRRQYHQRMQRDLDAIMALVPTNKEGKRLRKRYAKVRTHLFTFIENPEVAPDNNSSEREIRPIATYRKVTGGFRSDWGPDIYAGFRSVVATAARRGIGAFQAIKAVLQGKSVLEPG